jgi:hypothetical protein
MLSRAQHGYRLLEVQVVGRADVHYVYFRIVSQFVKRSVSAIKAQAVADFRGTRRGTGEYSLNCDALPSQGFQMRSTDKAKPNDRGPKRVQGNTSTVRNF